MKSQGKFSSFRDTAIYGFNVITKNSHGKWEEWGHETFLFLFVYNNFYICFNIFLAKKHCYSRFTSHPAKFCKPRFVQKKNQYSSLIYSLQVIITGYNTVVGKNMKTKTHLSINSGDTF